MVAHGKTEDEALQRIATMHELVVRRMKEAGAVALEAFMDRLGIEFKIQPDGGTVNPIWAAIADADPTNRKLAAAA